MSNAIYKFLEKNVKPNFEEGGNMEKFLPAYDALETFLFVPGHTTSGKGSHIRDGIDMKRTMIMVVLAMVPALLFGMWNTGVQHFLLQGLEHTFMDAFLYGAMKVLPIVVVSYAVGLGVEFIVDPVWRIRAEASYNIGIHTTNLPSQYKIKSKPSSFVGRIGATRKLSE